MSYPFTRLSSAVVAHALCPFLTNGDLARFFNTNKKDAREHLDTIRAAVEEIMYSRIFIFGQDQYRDYWRLRITDQFEPKKINVLARRTFLEIYYGPNPVDPTQGVKNTCLIPTVVPSWAIFEDRGVDVNLNLLGLVAEHPGMGNAAKYAYNGAALQQRGEATLQEEAYLVIVLKGVTGRGVSWESQVQVLKDLNDQTGYGCETEPKVRSLVAAIFAHYAVTGERAFGDDTSVGGRCTYSRTEELVHFGENAYHMIVGGFSAWPVGPLGGPAPAVLRVDEHYDFCNEYFGVGVLRKFR